MDQKNCPFKLGIHPINWVGEDVREHGDHYTYDQVLSEMADLGFTGTEVSRKFPKEKGVLKKVLAARGMTLITQWKTVLFSDPSYREQELQDYREHVLFLKEMGCKVVSTCEGGGSLHWDPRRSAHATEVTPLDDRGWKSLAEGLNLAGEICHENGMKLVYHHHAGTVVERPEDIERLMSLTDPELVYLLFDTGHAYYGGNDPLTVLRTYFDRIPYVHLKDVRQDVLMQARKEGVDFLTRVKRGVFTVPGDGCIDFVPILKELLERGYDGWALIEAEQDPTVANPYEYAKKAKAYIEQSINDLI